MSAPEHQVPDDTPLAERFPAYLAIFGITTSIALVVGLIVAAATSQRLVSGAGYGVIILGVLYLLVGGTRGGGYANIGIGAVGTLFGGGSGRRYDEDPDDRDVRYGKRKRVDPMTRLRAGLRPERNPGAFWAVVGGFALIGAGIYFLSLFE